MERYERERILGEWGVRDGSGRDLVERRHVERELEGNPLRGRPLRRRSRNFRPDVDRYVASLGGPLPYMQRLREIEEATRAHEELLRSAWLALAREIGADEAAFAERWMRVADGWNFSEVNELIDRHNRFYPAEARLAMDPRTGDFVHVAGKPYRKPRLDAEWVLARFPASVAIAAAA